MKDRRLVWRWWRRCTRVGVGVAVVWSCVKNGWEVREGGKRGRVGRLRLGMQDWFLVLEGLLW